MGNKINCGNKRIKEKFNIGARLLRNYEGEALFNFGEYTDTKYSFVYGVGCVLSIKRGERADEIIMNFGRKKRKIIVELNHARRQVYTLKVGQFAHLLGMYRAWCSIDENGQKKREYKLFARALQGWYVPKQFDMETPNSDIREMSAEEEQEIGNILDNLEITQ